MTSMWMRGSSYLYYSSKIRKTLFDQGGEGRSEHTKGFCLPCAALCVAQVWSQAIASHHELRRADYSALLGVVRLLVCSPACLPATRKVLLRALHREHGWTA